MKITVSTESIEDLNCESMILGFFSDERPPKGYCGDVDWCFNGLISELIARDGIQGRSMEKVLFQADHRLSVPKILLLGLGEKKSLDYRILYHAGQVVLRTAHDIDCHNFAFDIPGAGRCGLDTAMMTESVLRGMNDFLSGDRTADREISASILCRNTMIEAVCRGMENLRGMAETNFDIIAGNGRSSAQDGTR